MEHILVVDDEPDALGLFTITLQMAGYTIDTAHDGLEAIDKIEAHLPDLILLDLMMPKLDGFGLAVHIRKTMAYKAPRVLVATAKVLEDSDHDRLGGWPVVGVVNKGKLDIGQIVSIVKEALSQYPWADPEQHAVVLQKREERRKARASRREARPNIRLDQADTDLERNT